MPDRLLQRRIVVADGYEIRTVNEALSLIEQRFNGKKCDALERTRTLLRAAASTGKRGDIKAATDQMLSVLHEAQMLSSDIRTRAHMHAAPKGRRHNRPRTT